MAAQNQLVDVFALNRFSTGRRLYTFNEVVRLIGELELKSETLEESVQRAREFDLGTRVKEGEWREAKGKKSSGRGRSAVVGNRVKRAIGAMHSTLLALLDEDEDDEDEKKVGAEVVAFLEKHFPEGAAAITNQDAEDLLSTVEGMNESFAKLTAKQRGRLNITRHVPRLARLTTAFAKELSRTSSGMKFKTLKTARETGHENLCKLVATIISEYQKDDPKTVDTRAALLAPIFEQNAMITARRKLSPAPDVEVDPDTGEELERQAAEDDEEEGTS